MEFNEYKVIAFRTKSLTTCLQIKFG